MSCCWWRSSLIAACERAGELDQALALVDSMHAAGVSHSPDLYAKLLERCAQALSLRLGSCGWLGRLVVVFGRPSAVCLLVV